jgi:hypothetical protein
VDSVLDAAAAGHTDNMDRGSSIFLGIVDASYSMFQGYLGPFAYYTHSLSIARVTEHHKVGVGEGVVCG